MHQLPATTLAPPDRTAPCPPSGTVADIRQEHEAIGELKRLQVGNGDGLVVLVGRERAERLLAGPHMTGGADLAEVLSSWSSTHGRSRRTSGCSRASSSSTTSSELSSSCTPRPPRARTRSSSL